MIERHGPSVSIALSRIGAQLERSGTVYDGLSLAEWSNSDSHAAYDHPQHHTLSLYLEGGFQVVRHEAPSFRGAPDKICLLPAGHESRWHIGGSMRMCHLYIDPEQLAYRALTGFGMDPRRIDLMDLTFSDDPAIAMLIKSGILSLDWEDASDRLALDSACQLVIYQVLERHGFRPDTSTLQGGLAPTVHRRIVDYVQAHLDQPLVLDQLAGEARLSTFHFARMFRVSFGMPPHRYVDQRRIHRACCLMRDPTTSLAVVALSCGYSSQSHFTRAFKAKKGVTPGQWRAAL
ncbi:MAG: AraC family transcriptional regulator [Mesorhizobium sp.]|uniref:helix-turn-helix transcriptional regulator n=1 Tax=Mesorhizobium sp. TaxID=1871066 RepID=UPI000FE54465|nr:AraC family transcriptional regulator [Mesorhizobium sp.]RWI50252.1 MAG: AraC family transcriptional regulator [Mesorhizobium sp.]